MKKNIALLICCILSASVFAQQQTPDPNYPKNYFRSPLNIPIFLAGNFGECRPGHFHSGIDIKTKGRENQPVYAAADGYISRIKQESGGFGHALYITHPNGYTTLYAHLNNYVSPIQKFLRQQQYKQERWNIDIELPPTRFPVKKGQQIAWSGNTGASTAPHLHFEIRNTKTEHPLNPELFGIPIIDTRPPLPTQIAIYDLNKGIYEQDADVIPLHKNGGNYQPATETVTTTNLVGIGVNVNDYMNGSDNTIAFYKAALYMDNVLQCEVRLDDIGYDETRYVNAYSDYKTREQRHIVIQCMFKLPGNHLDNIYTYLNDKRGALSISDDNVHKIRLKIIDDKGNSSTVAFNIQATKPATGVKDNCTDLFKANMATSFKRPDIYFTIGDRVLYDDICFKYDSRMSDKDLSNHFMVHHAYVPAHTYFDLNIKAGASIPGNLKEKIAMMHSDGKDEDGRAALNTEEDWYKASVRNFGEYWLAADTVPPVVKSLQVIGGNMKKLKQITFTVKDRMTSVKKFTGEIDGKWVCFEQHNDLFFYKFDEHCPAGKHTLVIKATDENNNTRELRYTFTR